MRVVSGVYHWRLFWSARWKAPRMRVLHVGKFFAPFAGGIENFMLDLTRASHVLGVAQACIVHQAPGQSAETSPSFSFLEQFRCVPTVAQVSYAPVSPGFYRAMARMLEQFQPDVLHLHLPNTSAFWALRSRRARMIPWVLHWHSDVVGPGLDAKLKLLYPFYRPFEQALLKRAAAVIVTSPPYLASSHALAPWRDKCKVIPLGLDPARVRGFSPARTATRPDGSCGQFFREQGDRLKVLAVGRLSRYKGFDVLIKAAARASNVELVIAGNGELRARLERLLRESGGSAGRIRLAGNVSDVDRNRLLGECDLLCMPSLNRAEAFGLSLLEAMAVGKPAIATDVAGSGMGWVVQHARTGWRVKAGSVGALAELLERLAGDRSSLTAAGLEARARFESRFRIDAVAREVIEVYRDCDRFRVR